MATEEKKPETEATKTSSASASQSKVWVQARPNKLDLIRLMFLGVQAAKLGETLLYLGLIIILFLMSIL